MNGLTILSPFHCVVSREYTNQTHQVKNFNMTNSIQELSNVYVGVV